MGARRARWWPRARHRAAPPRGTCRGASTGQARRTAVRGRTRAEASENAELRRRERVTATRARAFGGRGAAGLETQNRDVASDAFGTAARRRPLRHAAEERARELRDGRVTCRRIGPRRRRTARTRGAGRGVVSGRRAAAGTRRGAGRRRRHCRPRPFRPALGVADGRRAGRRRLARHARATRERARGSVRRLRGGHRAGVRGVAGVAEKKPPRKRVLRVIRVSRRRGVERRRAGRRGFPRGRGARAPRLRTRAERGRARRFADVSADVSGTTEGRP